MVQDDGCDVEVDLLDQKLTDHAMKNISKVWTIMRNTRKKKKGLEWRVKFLDQEKLQVILQKQNWGWVEQIDEDEKINTSFVWLIETVQHRQAE